MSEPKFTPKQDRFLIDALKKDIVHYLKTIDQLRAEVEKMKFTARELELLSGMVDVHQSHADRCDHIPSRMASKQKGWDLERVALLKRIIKAGEVDDE